MSDRFIKPALLCLSLVASIRVGELLARIALDEVNCLRPTLVAHPILRHAVRAGSGGPDRWGFRNGRVPADVDVLADSETYGYSAPSVESWPSWLERLSGRSVYNMGFGGYGPPDYRYFLEQQGDSLDPDVVIIGFYS